MSDTIEDILYATLEMGEDVFAPMAEVHKLATRWAEYEDTPGVLATLDDLIDHEALRVRTVCLIALRTIGERGLACDRDVYRRVTLLGLRDEHAHVRLFAAWLAGTFTARGSEIDTALAAMIADLGTPEAGSPEDKALRRAIQAAADIGDRPIELGL